MQRSKVHENPDPTSHKGLTADAVKKRLDRDGFNELTDDGKRGFSAIALGVLKEPMLALLLAGGIVYLLLGDLGEALILLVFATASVSITVYQEFRTERVLDALRDLASPEALVIREGKHKRIDARELVRDDLLLLGEGDKVPADAIVLECHDLQTDESLLTGESVPVGKTAASAAQLEGTSKPGGDGTPYVFSGSLVVRGSALCKIRETGPRSEIGKIGVSLATIDEDKPRLSKEIGYLVRIFAILGVTVSTAAVLLYGLLRGNWLEGVLSGIALGMSMLPEEFPVVLTVFMAMGAWRISKVGVLARKATTIETLGSATVLCTDKTGTLTENSMSVVSLALPDGTTIDVEDAAILPENYRGLLRHGILACASDPFDPMEKAFHAHTGRVFANGHPQQDGWALVQEYGLRPDLLAMTQVWDAGNGDVDLVVAAKGAPEAIIHLCGLEGHAAQAVRQTASNMASKGIRVLGIAEARHANGAAWPKTARGFSFRFLGLAGLADPLKSQVPAAIAECHQAGLRVVMITGDYPETALAIAADAGIISQGAITGEMMADMDDATLRERVANVNVFARIMPAQKLRIINAFKANGEIVAMTGDGVNDAPSLKAANIGIAMGGKGTDVAREAASLVLMDDDFSSIVKAIRLGRRIYENMRKAATFILAIHLPIAGLALMPLVLSLPVVFGPVHIAFLEMAIDPTCSLVFESEREEQDIMRRPPRSPKEKLLPRNMVLWGMMQGGLTLAITSAAYFLTLRAGMPVDEMRSFVFVFLVSCLLVMVLANRSFQASIPAALLRPNPALVGVVVLVGSLLTLALAWAPFRALMQLGPISAEHLGIIAACAIAYLMLLSVAKWVFLRLASRM